MNTSVSFFEMLKPIAGNALEQALNRVLALIPIHGRPSPSSINVAFNWHWKAPSSLWKFWSKAINCELGPCRIPKPIWVYAVRSRVPCHSCRFFARATRRTVGKVRINGDAELARQLQNLAKNFDPDWDKPFAEAFGVIIGPQIAKALREAFKQGTVIAKKFSKDGVDYLTEESRDVVSGAEQAAFNEDVDDLRDRAERILARFEKLKQAQEPNA